ncbi:MAG: helix-turn-helix domain-containing protein [Melioribacteraceae bacterium]|nr:MAG: helix-turn-helix domain-containing protein [Melioribacteraceae bacterium]
MSVTIQEYRPSPDLSPYIEYFWGGSFNTKSVKLFSQRVVPNGYVELIIHLSDLHCELLDSSTFTSSPDFLLIGLYSLPYEVNFKGAVNVFGVRFKPEGFYQLFGIPVSEFSENYTDLESLSMHKFRDHCKVLREINDIKKLIFLTEQFFRKNFSRSKINLYYLNKAADLIRKSDGLITVDELASKVFISKRQLEREFKQKVGMSPKSYMRLARLNKVNRIIKEGKEVELSYLAYICGYSDQAHFIRDFKKFTGEAPKVFINELDEFIINPNSSEISK